MLLPTYGHLRRQDGPVVVVMVSPKSLERAMARHRDWEFFLGTSHERSISSRSLALSLFEGFTPFLLFNCWHSNTSTLLSVLGSAKSSSTISSWLSSGAHGYDHMDDSSWKGTSARGAGDVPMRGAGTVGAGAGVEVCHSEPK